MKKNTLITVVIPALNEEKNIEKTLASVHDTCRRLKLSFQTIVVDDGSRDETPKILKRLKADYPAISVITHKRPLGIGGAFIAGVQKAKGEAVVIIPGDNENQPEDILRFLHLLQHVDIIVPFVHNADLRDRWRRLISSIYRFIISFSFGTTLNYYNGTVIYRTRLIRPLPVGSRGFFYQAEILIRALRQGALFAEVPVLLNNRTHGKSKAISFRSLRGVIIDFFRLFWDIHFLRGEARQKSFPKK